jgi:hypothetical protein
MQGGNDIRARAASDEDTLPQSSASIGSAATVAADEAAGRSSPLRRGDSISRYAILSELGRGGMGVVYRAFDPQLDREVALKLLIFGDESERGRVRLLREAKATAKVRHPNVVAVHDAGEIDGRMFVAMELVDGITVRAWLRQARRSWRDVLRIMIPAGEGLAAAHAAALVHRDFKPENVMVEGSGRVRVLDFGLARESHDSGAITERGEPGGGARRSPLASVTQTGAITGTPAYMSPEQYRGEPADARTDQFSFCVALHEALYGQRPFRGATPEALMFNVLAGNIAPPPPAAVPSGLQRLIRRGLSLDPAARYASMEELLELLRAELLRSEPARGRRIGAIVAAAAVIAIGGLAFLDAEAPAPEVAPTTVIGPIEAPRHAPEASGTPTPPSPPEEPPVMDVFLPRPAHVPAGAAVRLLTPVGAPALTLIDDPAGIRVRGEAANTWVPVLQAVLSTIDHPTGRQDAPMASAVLRTPDGQAWIVLRMGDERLEHVKALRAIEGVSLVVEGDELLFALVRGEPSALEQALRRFAEANRPKYRKWCFYNSNMAEQRCRATQAECITDADLWSGPGTGRRLCRGRI